MTRASTASRSVSWFAVAVVTLLTATLLYVGSIAPAYRFSGKGPKPRVQRLYSPVFSLMEQTSLRTPLLVWCGVWGCRDDIDQVLRQREMRTWFDTD